MGEEISLEGGRAVVTGAGGFIGGAVCRRLVAEGAEVVGVDADPSAARRAEAGGAEPRIADVTDRRAMEEALAGADLVVHTAAIVSDAGSMTEHVRVNVGGTAAVLAAAGAAGARVLHVSSVVVYGYEDPSRQEETAPLRTCGVPYIDTKSAADRLARRRGAVVVRPGDVYGPESPSWTLRPLELARAGRLAYPAAQRHMLAIHIDDLVEAIVVALARGEPGRAYTAWNDEERITFEDYFKRLAAIAGAPPPRRLPRPLLAAAGLAAEIVAGLRGSAPEITRHAVVHLDRRGTVATDRLRALGWEPRVGLEEGLARTARSGRLGLMRHAHGKPQ